MIALILALDPASSPEVPRSRGVCVVYKFFKRTAIPEVGSELDSRANIFGASDKLDAFQDNLLKIDHPLRVTLPSLYAV